MKRTLALVLSFLTFSLFLAGPAWSQPLTLSPEDLVITQSLEGGYDLYVRKTAGIESVLLTESSADPEKRADSFALRNPEYHRVNGDEKRILNGEFLDSSGGLYSLIDSTPEAHPDLGEAFHIFIPYIVVYGYPWSRSGEIMVLDGTWLSVRAFGAPYADYEGGFADNPFILRVVQKPMEGPPEGNYMDDTVETYREIAEAGKGEVVFSTGEEGLLDSIRGLLQGSRGRSLDLVLALDTTESMTNDMPALRRDLVSLLEEETSGFGQFRFGMVFYKDYLEEFLTRVIPFQAGLGNVQTSLNRVKTYGGRDIPEAVYEALYSAIHDFPWQAEVRKVILVGDAPPHPRPRGEITGEMVYTDAERLGIELNTIILPQ